MHRRFFLLFAEDANEIRHYVYLEDIWQSFGRISPKEMFFSIPQVYLA
jgi:hypothetical protein